MSTMQTEEQPDFGVLTVQPAEPRVIVDYVDKSAVEGFWIRARREAQVERERRNARAHRQRTA